MQISVFTQINIIAILIIGLVFCIAGYKFARFLLPVCGMVVIEVLLYLLVGGYIRQDELISALFYGGTAVASYVILFFFLRLPAFFTGAVGAGFLSYLVLIAFKLIEKPFAFPVFITVLIIVGFISFAYRRVGVIIATSLLGAGLAGAAGAFFVLAPHADYANGLGLIAGLESVIKHNGYIFFAVFMVLALLALIVQLKVTGNSQFLEERLKIAFDSRKKK